MAASIGSFASGGRSEIVALTASARPSIGGEVLYVGSADGTLSALRASDGTPLWSHATGSPITDTPTIDDGTVLVGSADGTITAFTLGGN